MQKGSAQLLLILAVIIIIFGGLYVYWATRGNSLQNPKFVPSEQSNPQALNDYFNKDLGFTFQYAKDLSVKIDSEEEFNKRGNGDYRKNFKGYVGYEPGQVVGAAVVLGKDDQYETNQFSVWVFSNDKNLTIEQWFQNYWYYPFVWGVFDYTSKGHIALDTEATISGTPAKYKVIAYQPSSPKFMYISNGKKMYLFRIIGEMGDQILSTFKFIN